MGKVASTGTKSEQRWGDWLLEETLYIQEAWPDIHGTAGINLGNCPGPLQGSSGNPSLLFGRAKLKSAKNASLFGAVIERKKCSMDPSLLHSAIFFSTGSSGNRVWLAKRVLIFSEEREKFTQLSPGLQNIQINVSFHSTKKHAPSQVMQLDVWFVFTPFFSIPFLILSISVHFIKVWCNL